MTPKQLGSSIVLSMLNLGSCDLGALLVYMYNAGFCSLALPAFAILESHGKYMSDVEVNDRVLAERMKGTEGKEMGKTVRRE